VLRTETKKEERDVIMNNARAERTAKKNSMEEHNGLVGNLILI